MAPPTARRCRSGPRDGSARLPGSFAALLARGGSLTVTTIVDRLRGKQEESVREYRQYIGGQWVGAARLFDDLDPYRGMAMARVPAGTGTDAAQLSAGAALDRANRRKCCATASRPGAERSPRGHPRDQGPAADPRDRPARRRARGRRAR